MDITTFEAIESTVRSYSRAFPTVFEKGLGSTLIDISGKRYLDFFSGAGALNYGHNNSAIKNRVLNYLADDNIIHSLDMATRAKGEFLERFRAVILEPRGLRYRVQFPGPTGTNAVEAALKLARKTTGRREVIYFTGAFHGMTLGAMSVAGDPVKRADAGVPLSFTREMPFEADAPDGLSTLERYLDNHSVEQRPAAVILETVQAEGGVRAAGLEWLRHLRNLCQRYGVLMVVDDIQVGCGRTGTFFSFEGADIQPDIVCLSKSISGFGLPMSLVLMSPALDRWRPGEHNGTFRGQNLSFVAATEALNYWQDGAFALEVESKALVLTEALERIATREPVEECRVVGRGLIQGLRWADPTTAKQVSRAAFERGVVIECAGLGDEVLKFLPALTITREELLHGLEIIDESLAAVRRGALGEPVLVAS